MSTKIMKSRFLWVANWLAVDFANTDIMLRNVPVDLLNAPQDLSDWLSEAGVWASQAEVAGAPVSEVAVTEAKRYRTLLRRGLVEITAGRPLPEELLQATNNLMAKERRVDQLAGDVKGYRIVSNRKFGTPASYAAPIAESFAKLMVDGDLSRLRKCRSKDCVLYFYDTSKSGTRSWCSLDICGNKLRMAASRQRNSQAPLQPPARSF